MKNLPLKLIAAAAGFIPIAGYSQYAYTQNMAFALTESSSAPALIARDASGKAIPGAPPVYQNQFTVISRGIETATNEFASKMVLFKISNREILLALQDEGVISTIVGYSITQLYTDNSNLKERDTTSIYLTKRGLNPIDVSDIIRLGLDEANAVAITGSARTSETTNLTTNARASAGTASYSSKELYNMSLQFQFGTFFTAGANTSTRTLRIFGTGESRYASLVPGASRLNGLIGYGTFTNNSDPTLLEGSVSIAAGIPTTLPIRP